MMTKDPVIHGNAQITIRPTRRAAHRDARVAHGVGDTGDRRRRWADDDRLGTELRHPTRTPPRAPGPT
ncbi:hypothetical protein, partial [Streptomyces coriariae]|uniref:hypothetical protein n=1 Tax=Streptomyces coriariae TaxID=2864460 RepID=UPI001E3F9CEF